MRRKQGRRFVAWLLTVTMLLTPILSFNTLAAEIGSIATHMTYRLKNVGSGKYLTVYGGTDAESINICQSSKSNNIRVGFQHMITNSSPLSRGDVVEKGDVIGLVGGSGKDKNGDPYAPHLHLGIWNGINDHGTYDFASPTTARNPLRFFPRVPFTGDRSRTYP